MDTPAAPDPLYTHRDALFGLCYRMLGDAAEAEDVVQDTLLRALERPPADPTRPLRPWLLTIALNLSRDRLRARRRRAYTGPWLPSPLDPEPLPATSPTARYDTIESLTFAFLLALEALTPNQRAVLLLRDVFDYSTEEAAALLHLSESNIKTTLHRARRAMDTYDTTRVRPGPELYEAAMLATQRFLAAIAAHDVAALEALLTPDVLALSDGGGEFLAAGIPVTGSHRIATMFVRLNGHQGAESARLANLNGLPGLIVVIPPSPHPRRATLVTLSIEPAPDGRIRRIYNVLASNKLSALPTSPPPP